MRMADIDIRELRAYEPYCVRCGESGPIETSAFLAFAWEQSHQCDEDALDGRDTDELSSDLRSA